MNDTEHNLSPLLAGADAVAKLLDVSARTVWLMNRTGELGPLPVRLRGRTLWRTDELAQWVRLGCPLREKWLDCKDRC